MDWENRMTEKGKCKGCGADIVWVMTKKLKCMPCDPEEYSFVPDKGGRHTFVTADGSVVKGEPSEAGMLRGYVSHFATCEYAAQFRRG